MSDIYAEPRLVTNLAQCIFYHTMDIPGFGHVDGSWDLRGHERQYLGNIDFADKRVLEVGVQSIINHARTDNRNRRKTAVAAPSCNVLSA